MAPLPFRKMHGLGNDFVVLDARGRALDLSEAQVRRISDRHTGVGCDQFIIVRPPKAAAADAFMEIRNADGAEVEACGNATRCIAKLLTAETGRDRVTIETVAGLLLGTKTGRGYTVDMGEARTGWRDIPLARECDTLHVPLDREDVPAPVATNIGNPHATFFVEDAEAVDLAAIGRGLEHHPMFPARANIGFASLTAPDTLRLRVWERGVGITLACGSAACAAVVASARRGLTGRRIRIDMDGGPLFLEWLDNGHVLMTGGASEVYEGVILPSLLAEPAP
ncbi:MAG: diaminopimelate epimerase [Alphaproteobacteria bacterium]|nr:diaminopimelate epimerase [Alphaproteobacteria bacterium]MCB9931321.1 diaminopimelate epimerase [Alphaproteobacteria bacterium]